MIKTETVYNESILKQELKYSALNIAYLSLVFALAILFAALLIGLTKISSVVTIVLIVVGAVSCPLITGIYVLVKYLKHKKVIESGNFKTITLTINSETLTVENSNGETETFDTKSIYKIKNLGDYIAVHTDKYKFFTISKTDFISGDISELNTLSKNSKD